MLGVPNYNSNKRLTERKFRVTEDSDPIISIYFSPNNIYFIQTMVVKYVKERTGVDINTTQDEQTMIIKMQEFIEMYRSNRHMLKPDTDIKILVASLNKQIIEYYINQVISGIQAYTHYHSLISNPPTNYNPMPKNVSIKGANVLGVNVGFLSSHDRNQNNRQFNLKYK